MTRRLLCSLSAWPVFPPAALDFELGRPPGIPRLAPMADPRLPHADRSNTSPSDSCQARSAFLSMGTRTSTSSSARMAHSPCAV